LPRRKRLAFKYLQVLKFLEPCQGYELGKTIDEIADKIYERHDFASKARARQLIAHARRAARLLGMKPEIFSQKPEGMDERRYFHLTTVAEYTKTIHDLQEHIEGTQKTEKKLTLRRKTAEERAKLEEVRRDRAKTRSAKKRKT